MLMHQRFIQKNLLVLYLLLNYDGVQGKTVLSKHEELELEEQLKLLNKPSIKTIKSKFGDIYNCVDFYKQLAFDHPLLKNHNFHPEASRSNQKSRTSAMNWSSRMWSKDGGCPFGTVPIKKITKEDLIRQRNMELQKKILLDKEICHHQKISNSKKFNEQVWGAGLTSSVYNPHVEGRQHSACRLKIQKGSDILQVGWRVDPTLYRDNKTRLFVHFQAGNKHCFNVLCPGFVLVNTKVPVDLVFDDVSQRGKGDSLEFTAYIDRDLVNGYWWLLIDNLDERYQQVGFWPQKIFTSLTSFANNVEWGGVTYSPPGVPKPPMGSSFFPVGNTGYDAYCRNLTVLNTEAGIINVDGTTIYVDDPNLYKVSDYPYMRPGKSQLYVLYGGPGESHQL
ncbi:hypothetical protein P3S67_002947 [Capsicum chacoense]